MALVWGGAAGYDGHCIHRDKPSAIKLKPSGRRRRGNERAVPELTQNTAIQLNKRVLLRRSVIAISSMTRERL